MVFTQLNVVFEYFMMRSTESITRIKHRICSQVVQIDFVQCLVNVDIPKYQFMITVHELKLLKVK